MVKKLGLGRGLSSLISTPVPVSAELAAASSANEDVASSKSGSGVRYVPIDLLVANSAQPRQRFDLQEISNLSSSIKTHGVLQPILVRPRDSGKLEIVAGERRYRASLEAGLAQVPVIVREFDDRTTLEVALVENVQRQDLNPIEEARGYQRLMDAFSLTTSEVADKVGKDRATISNAVRILRLPPSVVAMVESGELSAGHAKAILSVKEPMAQVGLAEKVRSEALSVRALEAIVSREVALQPKSPITPSLSPSATPAVSAEILDRLRHTFGTKVLVRGSATGPKVIEIHCHSDDEFNRILEKLNV